MLQRQLKHLRQPLQALYQIAANPIDGVQHQQMRNIRLLEVRRASRAALCSWHRFWITYTCAFCADFQQREASRTKEEAPGIICDYSLASRRCCMPSCRIWNAADSHPPPPRRPTG